MASIEPLYADLGRRIRDSRREQGLTQEQLGARLAPPVTRASIANIETGKQRVLVHTLMQLAEAMKMPLEELLPKAVVNSPRARAEEPLQQIREELKRANLPPKAVRDVTKELRLAPAARRRE